MTCVRCSGLAVFAVLGCALGCSGDDDGPAFTFDDSGRLPSEAGSIDAGRPPLSEAGDPGGSDAGVCVEVVDVVFVLDVSSSMDFFLENLGGNISRVVTAAADLAPDPHFGLIGFADNAAFATGGALEGGRVHTEAATLETQFRYFLSTYTFANRNPGDGPTGPDTQNPICEENSIDALYAAATEFPWRENATRVVIVATDDTFLEPPDNYGDRDGDGRTDRTDFPREGDYPALHSMSDTVAALRAARIRVFSFTRLEEPSLFDLGRCGTPRRYDWPHVSDGWSTPYMGQTPIPESTDGRNYDLVAVRDGALSLADTIAEVVVESYCDPFI